MRTDEVGATGRSPLRVFQDELGHVVLDDEQRAQRGAAVVSAVEIQVICAIVIVVIYRKAQAELGHAGQVDIGEGAAVEGHRIPAAGGCVLDRTRSVLTGCCLKVGQLQGVAAAKGALADVHQDVAMDGEGVGADQTLLLDLESDFGDDGVIRQAGCVERQDGAVLAVAGVVTQREYRGGGVHRAALAAGLAGFKHPSVLTAGRAIRFGQRRVHDIHRRQAVVESSAVAQLTGPVGSPALDPAARSQRTGVIPTGGDGANPARQPAHVHRRVAFGGRAVAQLTVLVPSPALDPAARSQGTGVIHTGVDGSDPARQQNHVYRRVTVGGRAVAQLTVPVGSPALDPIARSPRAGVIPTGGDGADPARQPAHVYRSQALGGRAVAQLTVVVGSPALDPAARSQRTGVIITGGDGADPARQPAHGYRLGAVGGRAVAQFTVPVVSPALDTAARGQRTGVIPTGGDGADPARQPAHIYRRGAVGGRAVAQLTVPIPSPALDTAARGQCTGVSITGGDGADPARQPAHIYRRQAVGGRAVAQLTIVILSPALDPAARSQPTGVHLTGGDGSDIEQWRQRGWSAEGHRHPHRRRRPEDKLRGFPGPSVLQCRQTQREDSDQQDVQEKRMRFHDHILLMDEMDIRMFLWNMILDNEQRAVGFSPFITAIELEVVSAQVVVIILLEAQAELCHAGQVDIGEGTAVEDQRIPAAGGCVLDRTRSALAGCCLKVGQLQGIAVAKGALAYVHQDVTVGGEGIRADQTLLLDLERDFGDDGVIRQAGCSEGQDGAVLAVASVVTQIEHRGGAVHCPARVADLAGFEHPSVLTACRAIRFCQRRHHDIHRRQALGGRAVAQLTVGVISPALDPAARGPRTGVRSTGGDGADPARQPAHVYRRVTVCGRAVAQLTVPVVSPALDPAARSPRTGVISTGVDGADPARQPAHVYRCQVPDGRAVAQLTVLVVSPALDPAARSQGTGVIPTCGDGADPARQPTHIYRRVAVGGRAVAQLTARVPSPTLDPAA